MSNDLLESALVDMMGAVVYALPDATMEVVVGSDTDAPYGLVRRADRRAVFTHHSRLGIQCTSLRIAPSAATSGILNNLERGFQSGVTHPLHAIAAAVEYLRDS